MALGIQEEAKPVFKMYVPKNARGMAKCSNEAPFNEDTFHQIPCTIATPSGRLQDP